MKIVIKHEPDNYDSDLFADWELDKFKYKAIFNTDGEATATDTVRMVLKAMLLEGYAIESICHAFIDVAEYEAFEHNIELEPDKDLETDKDEEIEF